MYNIEKLENFRKKIRNNKILLYIIMFFMFILFDIFVRKDKFDELIFFIIILYSGFSILIVESIFEKNLNFFKKQYRKTLFLEALKNKCNIISCEEDNGISCSVIKKLNIISMGNSYKSDILIQGNHNKVNFECSNILISRVSLDRDGSESERTKFQGLWFIFDFNKFFKSNVKVIDRKFAIFNRGLLSDKINKEFNTFKDTVAEINHEEFSNRMKVYLNETENVFEVLTDTIIYNILKLNNNIDGRILLYFIDNKLHIGVHNYNDMFKTKIYRKNNYDENIEKISKQLDYIFEFIEIINSNNDIFTC